MELEGGVKLEKIRKKKWSSEIKMSRFYNFSLKISNFEFFIQFYKENKFSQMFPDQSTKLVTQENDGKVKFHFDTSIIWDLWTRLVNTKQSIGIRFSEENR